MHQSCSVSWSIRTASFLHYYDDLDSAFRKRFQDQLTNFTAFSDGSKIPDINTGFAVVAENSDIMIKHFGFFIHIHVGNSGDLGSNLCCLGLRTRVTIFSDSKSILEKLTVLPKPVQNFHLTLYIKDAIRLA